MVDLYAIKITSAIAILGEIKKAGEVIEVEESVAKDLLRRGKALIATELDSAPETKAEAKPMTKAEKAAAAKAAEAAAEEKAKADADAENKTNPEE